MPVMKEAIAIDRIAVSTLLVPIVGLSPIIIHRFSEKQRRKMLDAMQGKKSQREVKDPEAEYEASRYRFEDGGDGFPVIGFKAATIGGARFYHGITMTALRQFMFFRGEIGLDGQQLARIEGKPRMREDTVRVDRGGADLRYRAEFPEWRTTLEIVYATSALTSDSVLSLLNAGGMGCGVGGWRPEKNGDFGTYAVDTERRVTILDGVLAR